LDPVTLDLNLAGPTDLLPRNSQQCILVTDIKLLSAQQSLWLHNLYIRFSSTHRTQKTFLLDCFGSNCNLWLNSTTLQGQLGEIGVFPKFHAAVAVVGGQLYAQGVRFRLVFPPAWIFAHKRPQTSNLDILKQCIRNRRRECCMIAIFIFVPRNSSFFLYVCPLHLRSLTCSLPPGIAESRPTCACDHPCAARLKHLLQHLTQNPSS
jgi:hypothetical protein